MGEIAFAFREKAFLQALHRLKALTTTRFQNTISILQNPTFGPWSEIYYKLQYNFVYNKLLVLTYSFDRGVYYVGVSISFKSKLHMCDWVCKRKQIFRLVIMSMWMSKYKLFLLSFEKSSNFNNCFIPLNCTIRSVVTFT